ncbi:PREDICTED: LOW QUALITY PROTEIN: rap guanine nucleotide exchange factor-like 1 [Ficedula albicollis]|uniref:LOW QUALITY PROTEIN: rap guanine nucleotide exchange factor-like 1 n=1 Tax=Ficedula albicollis TaxID=59894 RepID=UPI0007AD7A0B|nr:PREDICTED: LOW QUALITY PROTEIN: rap guanine nucleotide exchange factor-like 1 [Ficedula albicollis]
MELWEAPHWEGPTVALVAWELLPAHLCRAASTSAAAASCQPPTYLPTPNGESGRGLHSAQGAGTAGGCVSTPPVLLVPLPVPVPQTAVPCFRQQLMPRGAGAGGFEWGLASPSVITIATLTYPPRRAWGPRGCRGALWGSGATPVPLSPESLLDDIVLTHSLFLPTERFLQQLHQQYPGGPRGGSGLRRKRAVLAVLLHFLETYKGLLQEEESAGKVIKELYLLIMKDTSLYHELEDEIIKLHQLVETVELKVADETPPPNKQVKPPPPPPKPLFRHFRRIDSCLQTRVAFRGSDEIFCRVYMPDHSYVTIRSRLSASVQDILASVTEKLQYSEEQSSRGDALILVTMASSGEKAVLQPSEECVFTTLGINSHLFACTRDTFDSLVPLPEEIQVVPGDTEIHRAEPEDVANHLTAFHWELFRCIHEGGPCVPSPPLMLSPTSCKQNQDMLSFYAIVIGLNNAAISRLRLTWEKLPGKFKNLFRKFENLTDPCRNHKTYREVLAKMKPPLIPFVPLILKDLTFLHEGSKTLLDGLVNVEKLHCIAEKVRTVRKYRSRPLCLELEASPAQLQTKAYVRQLRVIDNQNLLFELSYKLEPGSQSPLRPVPRTPMGLHWDPRTVSDPSTLTLELSVGSLSRTLLVPPPWEPPGPPDWGCPEALGLDVWDPMMGDPQHGDSDPRVSPGTPPMTSETPTMTPLTPPP